MNEDAPGHAGAGPVEQPVTVVITRRVKAGREKDYEAWLLQLQADARGVPGYLGVTTLAHAADHPLVGAVDLSPATSRHLSLTEVGTPVQT